MPWLILADLILLIHLAFVLFVLFGGLLVLSRPRFALLHVPAVVWGSLVEIMGWVCPLTPLEDRLRRLGGATPYAGDFIERYLFPVLYPEPLAREIQIALGGVVIVVNLLIYVRLILRKSGSGH